MPDPTAVELAKALRQLVNAPLPPDLDPEHPFWVACRNARATLAAYESVTGIDGEQDDGSPSYRTWPSEERIALIHSLSELGTWSRDWSRFDFSDCKHASMVGVTSFGFDQPEWNVEICSRCGYVESTCNHNEFEWNEAGTLLRCKTCGIDGT